jgi:extracellular factor (EF) 3-hydroxypalmitic acid methyl ester biosynthesis protein
MLAGGGSFKLYVRHPGAFVGTTDLIRNQRTQLLECISNFRSALETHDVHETISSVHRLCKEVDSYLVSTASTRNDIKDLLAPALELHAKSPFIERLQKWPRGYQGDFETIEWLSDARPRLDTLESAYWLEWYALNCPIAQQHRNKLVWQRGLIERATLRGGRILNIGCGGCADLADNAPFLRDCEFVLIDMDEDALALAAERLESARSIKLIRRDVLRGLREASELGPFDAIICGGPFDYLDGRVVSRILGKTRSLADRDCCIAFTNISNDNPYRTWIENLANWKLIHRSEADIRNIVRGAEIDIDILQISRDA